jgi:aconitate hydratase
MAQKILAGRAADPSLAADLVEVKVDQVVLVRDPLRAAAEGVAAGLKKPTVELAMAYDTTCVRHASDSAGRAALGAELLTQGIVLARPGIGFPEPVHLERFASPARLCVTDEPRLAGVGGIGMLSLPVSPAMLGQALARGKVWVRPPRSIQVQLSGRMRPFVCARDVSLELLRRGLGEVVRKIEATYGAPVVLEFVGPSARLLSVGERAVLCAIAPELGALGALFVGDERTEVFLRDQRRSKAHRSLVPDAGAPFEEVVALDLGAIDPLVRDEDGRVVPVRDLAGKPVSQVLLGGDGAVTLRDLFSVASLLKSKRVPARLEFLLAVPSRQMLEVLASAGALLDLIATGVRLLEPDPRIASGTLYPPPSSATDGTVGLRTSDSEPRVKGRRAGVVASAETLAYAVATGHVGDPRAFKRPVRVTVPRVLPTDDVLIVRERRAAESGTAKKAMAAAPAIAPWKGQETLELVEGNELALPANGKSLAVVCSTLDEVRQVANRAPELPNVRAVVAPFIPSALVTLFSGLGIAAGEIDAQGSKGLKGKKTIDWPAPSVWVDKEPVALSAGGVKVSVNWLAVDRERTWLLAKK